MSELWEDQAYECGCNLGSPLIGAICSFKKKELIHLWNSILLEPEKHNVQLSELLCLTTFKKTQHTMSYLGQLISFD